MMPFDWKTYLQDEKRLFEGSLNQSLKRMDPSLPLQEVLSYALMSGGKRIRPLIVRAVAKTLGSVDFGVYPALAIEYIHTASLIADDLPCMDNDDLRRDRPSLHKAFGEAKAQLATYALIAEGYKATLFGIQELKRSNFKDKAEEIGLKALSYVTKNTGLEGATGGQFFDLNPNESWNQEKIERMIHCKTGSFFEIAFTLGWLFGGGDVSRLDLVETLSYHYGQAFQLADDLEDLVEDKKQRKQGSLALFFDEDFVLFLIDKHLSIYEKCLEELKIKTDEMLSFSFLLQTRAQEKPLV